MTEKPPQPHEAKIERIPCEYTEENLQGDIKEWIEGPAMRSIETREEFKQKSFLQQFMGYQNNFFTDVHDVFRYLNDDGSLRDDLDRIMVRERLQSMVEKRHLKELYQVINMLGYDRKEIEGLYSGKRTDEQRAMVKNIWIEMRKLGFSRMDLIG